MMSFALCSKTSNFFDDDFFGSVKNKIPSCERDSFVSGFFGDRSNCARHFSKKWQSSNFALHTSTNFQNVIQDAAHM